MSVLIALTLSLIAADPVSPPAGSVDAGGLPPEVSKLIDDLQQQVQTLQARVEDLSAAQEETWLSEERAEEIRGLVQDVLADADTRASLLQDGATAGYNNGFFLRSADGNYALKIAGQIQFRAVYNSQENAPVDDSRFGFEMRRLKLFFNGNIVDPTWTYSLEVSADRSTGNFAAGEFVYIQKSFEDGWSVRAGQFKSPFQREEYVSARRLSLVERTLVNSQFSAGITQGVQLAYEQERWRAFATLTDGANQSNTTWNTEDTEYAVTGRIDWLAMGDGWKATEDYNSWRNLEETSLLVGGAVLYQNAEYGTGAGLPPPDFNNAEVENLTATVDVSAKFEGGFSAAGAIVYRRLEPDAAGAAVLEQRAATVQAGYFFTDDLEGVARYEWGDLDTAGVDELSIVTVGINKYFSGHNLKWQNDIGYSFNSVATNWASSSAGWNADSPGEDGQIVFRSQFQLLF